MTTPPTTEDQRQAHINDAIAFVLRNLLIHLRSGSSETLIKQILSTTLGLDATVTGLLLGSLLRSRINAAQPAMDDYLALLGNGVSATYYQNPDLTGTPITRTETTIDFSWGSGSPPGRRST